jgi:Trk K+ transport system NAD-binding subunit
VEPSAADAQTILTVFTLRSYERRHKRPNPLRICAEVRDPDNQAHARAAGADEVIESSLLTSAIVAHTSMHPGTSDVIIDLLSPKVRQTLYVESLMPMLGLDQRGVAKVRARLHKHDALFVGYRHRGQLYLNPSDEEELPLDAQLISICACSLAHTLEVI